MSLFALAWICWVVLYWVGCFIQIPCGHCMPLQGQQQEANYLASRLSAGDMTACAVLEKTTLKCRGNADYRKLPGQWGDESGEMGTNLPSIDLGVAWCGHLRQSLGFRSRPDGKLGATA